MKKRTVTGVILLMVVLGAGLWGAKWFSDRRLWTSNVRADAKWLFMSLKLEQHSPLEHHLRDQKTEAQEKLARSLIAHADVLTTTDFSSLTPRFDSSQGVLTASFACEGSVYVRFQSKNSGEYWNLFEITQE